MYAVIHVADLHKLFGQVRALDGLDLQVVAGPPVVAR
jgi:ABC-type histidine transport system ATPase subunit